MVNKILVVEDDIVVSKVCVEFLNKSGFKTKSVKSAEEAEEVLKNEEINTVLADIKLPGVDGINFTKNVKKKYELRCSYEIDFPVDSMVSSARIIR